MGVERGTWNWGAQAGIEDGSGAHARVVEQESEVVYFVTNSSFCNHFVTYFVTYFVTHFVTHFVYPVLRRGLDLAVHFVTHFL